MPSFLMYINICNSFTCLQELHRRVTCVILKLMKQVNEKVKSHLNLTFLRDSLFKYTIELTKGMLQ